MLDTRIRRRRLRRYLRWPREFKLAKTASDIMFEDIYCCMRSGQSISQLCSEVITESEKLSPVGEILWCGLFS